MDIIPKVGRTCILITLIPLKSAFLLFSPLNLPLSEWTGKGSNHLRHVIHVTMLGDLCYSCGHFSIGWAYSRCSSREGVQGSRSIAETTETSEYLLPKYQQYLRPRPLTSKRGCFISTGFATLIYLMLCVLLFGLAQCYKCFMRMSYSINRSQLCSIMSE